MHFLYFHYSLCYSGPEPSSVASCAHVYDIYCIDNTALQIWISFVEIRWLQEESGFKSFPSH